ncbi:MAG TPA: protein translocase subunit SecD [Gemmatimonadaceae bacterium]|nr:protein translocase subunit SecD [Gemmatimonadaceae bacterium]
MSNLKYRLLLIGALCLMALVALFPRNKTIQIRDPQTGQLRPQVVRVVPLKKGLDLSGGTYFALGIDDANQRIPITNRKEAIERAVKTVRTRIDGMGVSETVVQTVGDDRIVVQIPGIEDPTRARQMVEEQAFLEFLIVDKSGSLEKVLGRLDAVIKQRGLAANVAGGDTAATTSVTGLEGLLKSDTAKKVAATDSAAAQADTAVKPGGALSTLIRGGQMPGEYLVEAKDFDKIRYYLADSAVKAALPPGKRVVLGRDSLPMGGVTYKTFYVTDAKPMIDGSGLTKAQPNQSPTDGTIVEFELNNEAGRIFRRETGKNIDRNMAIVLDGMAMGQPPVIRGAIGTRGQITMGGKDLTAAQDLALVLQAGALPVKLRIEEQRQIGPSLGEDSISKGITAGIIGIVLVVLIMVIYYRFSGMLAVGSLTLYVLFTAAILASFGAALTLPGLAGFVLSIGIAVDANVLIFERIREELDHGKTVRTAIDEGFRHAMPAIIDSNVSTILTAAVLYQFGTGPVRGFAVTLIAGIVASLVTSIFVVRTFYLLWLNRQRGAAQTLSI